MILQSRGDSNRTDEPRITILRMGNHMDFGVTTCHSEMILFPQLNGRKIHQNGLSFEAFERFGFVCCLMDVFLGVVSVGAPKTNWKSPWKMTVGFFSVWNGPFLGDMWIPGGFFTKKWACLLLCPLPKPWWATQKTSKNKETSSCFSCLEFPWVLFAERTPTFWGSKSNLPSPLVGVVSPKNYPDLYP